MNKQAAVRNSKPLEGEEISSERWEDARHWISIYSDLVKFKLGLLDRVEHELPKLALIAQKAASEDVTIIRHQLDGYYVRLQLWFERLWKLQGLWLDPVGRTMQYQGNEVKLTEREFELLDFLIAHPNRYFSASQIMTYAWSDSALYPEEVRNYILRLRRILKIFSLPCYIANKPGKGYALTFLNS